MHFCGLSNLGHRHLQAAFRPHLHRHLTRHHHHPHQSIVRKVSRAASEGDIVVDGQLIFIYFYFILPRLLDPFTAYLLNNSYETERFPDQWSTAIFSSLEQDASYTFKPSYSPSPYTSPSSLASSPSRESSPTRSDRLHDQKRRFPCNIAGCGRRFTSQYTLKVHLEAHKPKAKVFFPCTEGCSERFSRQHDRLRHEVAKHGKVCEFLCDDCGRFFSTKKTLGNHKCPVAQGGTRWVIN